MTKGKEEKMKFNKTYLFISILIGVTLFISACSDSTDADNSETTNSNGEPQQGGTVTGGLDTAPGGMFNPVFYTDLTEEKMLELTHESLVSQNEALEFTPNLASDWKISDDNTEVTFTIQDGVTWHDGEAFTAEDVVFTYKTLADPEYTAAGGLRTTFVQPLLNYEAYNAGETDEFEAVTAEDEHTVTFKFEEANANMLYYASFPIIPEHVFGEMEISDIPKAQASLEPSEIIGTGPFQFSEMVEREQYVMTAYEDYWQGTPYLDKVVWKVVDQSIMIGLLEKGELDFIAQPSNIPAPDFDSIAENPSITTIDQTDFGYQVLGFKVNKRTTEDVENGVINPDNWVENEKLSNKNVRKAIANAINREGIVQGLLSGHGEVIESPIAQQFWAYDEEAVNHYSFDQEKAMGMLDEEGYVDVNDDGMREDPEGNEWVLNMNYPTGNEIRERVAPIIQEQLAEVGVNVNLRQPKEMSAYLEDIENDNNDWDLYLIGWGLSSKDPDPSELWSSKTPYNYSRWNNPEADQLLIDALEGEEAFDQDYREKKYAEWQKIFTDELPAVILFAEKALWGYNTRLNGVDPLPFTMYHNTHEWWVSK